MKPFVVAALAVGLVVVLRLAASSMLEGVSPMLLFVVAVMVASWVGGLLPGLFATALSVVAAFSLFVERDGWQVAQASEQIRLLLFVVVGISISGLCEVMHRHRRRAEEARNFAFSIVETIDQPLIVLDAELRVLRVNRAFYETFRATREETEGRLVYELGNGEWNIPELRALPTQARIENASVIQREIENDFPRMGRRIMRVSARRLLRESNHDPLFLLAVQDVTEHVQAERAARQKRDLLQVTLASIGDAVITTDLDGRVNYMNPTAIALTGWTIDEAQGVALETVFRIVNEANRQTADNPATKALREGVIVGLANHTVLIAKDGSERSIDDSAAPIQDERGRIIGAVLIFRDITEQRSVSRRIAATEARRTAMFESALDCIISIDHEGRIIEFNRSAEATFGHRRDDVLGKELAALIIPPAYRDLHRQGLAKYMVTGEGPVIDQRLELSALRSDGVEFPVELTVTRIPVSGPPLFTAYMRDITDRKRLQDELRQYAANLSEADRRKNEFLAMLAHELRNPLAPIHNALQIIRHQGNGAPGINTASDMMERQIRQMVRLVDDLLDVSRISRGKIALRRARTELASVVHQAVEAAGPFFQQKEQHLDVALPSQQIYLHADPTRLAQVVGNLLNNASKFSDTGGRITLSAAVEDSMAVLRVRDDGIGIAAENLPRIFEMFAQVDVSLERSTSGLGIGLTLVKNLVEMHGGSVEVQSAGAGQGTEFVVRLPIALDVQDSPAVEPASSKAATTPARRILVVDDNRDSAISLALLLEHAGHAALTAFDGVEAVQAATSLQPDIVLLDIGLPRLNGYEVARRIRGEAWGQKTVIVAMTGWGQDEDRQKSKAAGFDAHMVKPIDLHELMKLLHDLESAKP